MGATFSATPRNVLRAPRRRVTSDTYRRQDVKCKHVFEGIEVREGSHGHRHGSLIELEVRFVSEEFYPCNAFSFILIDFAVIVL